MVSDNILRIFSSTLCNQSLAIEDPSMLKEILSEKITSISFVASRRIEKMA